MRATMSLRYFDVVSGDGTRLRAWTNDDRRSERRRSRAGATAPTVLLCNGLGTNPYAWPGLLRDDCDVRVVSWNHRGIGGSDRPADESRVGVDAFVEDALAVLDTVGLDSAVAAGWSLGVNTSFELAARHPHRVSGLFAVAGTPGGTFSTMLGPLRVPQPLRHPLMAGLAYSARATGAVFSPVTTRLPWTRLTVGALRHSGFMFPAAAAADVQLAVTEFMTTDVQWYAHLAVAASKHRRVPLSGIRVPTTFVAGRTDLLTAHSAIESAAECIPQARLVTVKGSHFLPLEQPALLLDELRGLLRQVRADRMAR